MESKVADLLECTYGPIAYIKTNEKPENASGPKSNKGFACVMPFINRTIMKGFQVSLKKILFHVLVLLLDLVMEMDMLTVL